MVNLQRVVVVLLVITLLLSVISVVFNMIIYKMKSSDSENLKKTALSNAGNLGFVVEGSNSRIGGDYGG